MGYACPVCGVEQPDGVHLANHLAVTASLGRADHRNWLDDYAPEWGDCGPDELAARVTEFTPEIETPDVDDGGGRAPNLETELATHSRRPGRGGAVADRHDDEVESVLAEARELTEQMTRDDESDTDTANLDGEDGADPDVDLAELDGGDGGDLDTPDRKDGTDPGADAAGEENG